MLRLQTFNFFDIKNVIAVLLLASWVFLTLSMSCNFLDVNHPFEFFNANSCQEHSIKDAPDHHMIFADAVIPSQTKIFFVIIAILVLPVRFLLPEIANIKQIVLFRVNRLLSWIWAKCCIFLQKSFLPHFCAQRDF